MKSSFYRSVVVLVGGTGLAQLLTVAVLPLITRLYTPADFSLLAIFVAVTTMVSVSACLRLEIAIPVPERDEDAANLMAAALISSFLVAVLIGIVLFCFSESIVSAMDVPNAERYLWILPVTIWLSSSFNVMQYWATRRRRFGPIAQAQIGQSLLSGGTQLGGGWFGSGPLGLLLGPLVLGGAGLVGLARNALREDLKIIRSIRWSGIRNVLRTYQRFPRYSTLEAFANNASVQLPILLITAWAIGPEAGYLLLAMRAMALPMALIGNSVAQVYFSRAPEEWRNGRLGDFTLDVIRGLIKVGVLPLAFMGAIAPDAFPFVFGDGWRRAGELVAWMTPWFVVQFVTSPVSMVLHVTGSQRAALFLQIFGLALRIAAVGLAVVLSRQYIAESYALSGFIFYSVYLGVVIWNANVSKKRLMSTLAAGVPYAVAGALWGYLASFAVRQLF